MRVSVIDGGENVDPFQGRGLTALACDETIRWVSTLMADFNWKGKGNTNSASLHSRT